MGVLNAFSADKKISANDRVAVKLKQEFCLDEYEAFDDYLEMVIAFG